MKQVQERRKYVDTIVAFTKGTHLEAGAYECGLLEEFVQGVLTIEEVIYLVELAKYSD